MGDFTKAFTTTRQVYEIKPPFQMSNEYIYIYGREPHFVKSEALPHTQLPFVVTENSTLEKVTLQNYCSCAKNAFAKELTTITASKATKHC